MRVDAAQYSGEDVEEDVDLKRLCFGAGRGGLIEDIDASYS